VPILFPDSPDRPASSGRSDVDETKVQDEVTVETLIEDVSIDGMCGVY
jgi:mycofactocin precursor